MITVYVLVTFLDDNGVHKAGTICQVKESDFDPKLMKKLEVPTADAYTKEETDALLLTKQDELTAGTNITIDNDTISATDTGDTVTVTQKLTSGTEIGSIKVNNTTKKLYAPAGGSQVSIDQIQSTGTKIATITIDEVDTDIYAPAGGGGGGVSADVIADEFDTEQHVIQVIYNQYDFVKYQGYQYYWSPTNNNTADPGDGGGDWINAGTSIVTIDTWGSNVNAGQIFTYNNVYYVNKSSSQQYIRPEDLPGSYSVATNRGNWSAGSTDYVHYDVGDYCTYNDELYICTGATTGESWDSTKWNKITVMSQIDGGSSSVQTLSFNSPSDTIPDPGDVGVFSGTPVLGDVDIYLYDQDPYRLYRGTVVSADETSLVLNYQERFGQYPRNVLLFMNPDTGNDWVVDSVYTLNFNPM